MDPLKIFLIILVIAGIVVLVELALTLRKARDVVGEVGRSANEAIEQVQPIINKVDGMVDDLQPAVKQVQPLVEKAGTAVDVATVDLASLNDILSDVSDVTNTASNVSSAVNRVADNAATGVAGVFQKISGKGKAPQAIEGAQPADVQELDEAKKEEPAPKQAKGYVTYGEVEPSQKDAE